MLKTNRFVALAVVSIALWAGSASAQNLLFHQGFETCWVPGKTKSQFLEAIRTNIDGTSTCIPKQTGSQSGFNYTVCGAANGCGTGIEGCAVSISAGAFSGDFPGGQFVGPGSAADIVVPIVITGISSCSVNLNNITLGYTLDYLMQTDGTDGVYSSNLMPPGVEITHYDLVNGNCNQTLFGLIGSNVAAAISGAEENASAAIEPALRANTLDQSICPLSAP
ncbi:MAG TPA: hypothetical protein VFN25_02310 [Dokdonella sp.]|uniref:hypothetical protein n=1 Tax=Dokdonella sp. TaxID=2291710 RepID=UPI002D7FAE22|nr:hypothetical protein [Dokdonella sp.]HET9031717.1 hypothetical protein [Dokdonella sp.]